MKMFDEEFLPIEEKPMKWEYKTVVFDTGGFLGGKVNPHEVDEICNEMGQDAWELVTVTATASSQGHTRSLVLIFKRPIG